VIDSGVIAQPFRLRIALVMTKLPLASGYFFTRFKAEIDPEQRAKKSKNPTSCLWHRPF
jgi:hypothetical protein